MNFRVIIATVAFGFCTSFVAHAEDFILNTKFVCRIETGEKPALLKAGSLKAANLANEIKKASNKIESAADNVKKLTKNGASKTKIDAAKAKLATLKEDKKKITECKKGNVDTTNPQPTATPTSVPGSSGKVSASVVVKFDLYTLNSQQRCVFTVFGSWADVPGSTFSKVSFDRFLLNPPISSEEKDISPPYNDTYIDVNLVTKEPTGITYNAEPGFHQIVIGESDTFGDDCSSPKKDTFITSLQGNYGNVFVYKAG